MRIGIMVRQQIGIFLKTPQVVLFSVTAAFFLIFLFGQAFDELFALGDAPLPAETYFGITLLMLSVFQGAQLASWGILKEKKANTEVRLAVAPIGRSEVVFGIFLGGWITITALSWLVVLLNTVLLSIDYGPSIIPVLGLVSAVSLLAAAVGVASATLVRDERAANGLLSTLIPVVLVLGGCYVMIPESGFLYEISFISPIRWVNLALFRAFEGGANEYIGPAFIFCTAVSAVLLALTAIGTRTAIPRMKGA